MHLACSPAPLPPAAGRSHTALSVCASDVDRWLWDSSLGGLKRDAATCRVVAKLYYWGVKYIPEAEEAWRACNTKARRWQGMRSQMQYRQAGTGMLVQHGGQPGPACIPQHAASPSPLSVQCAALCLRPSSQRPTCPACFDSSRLPISASHMAGRVCQAAHPSARWAGCGGPPMCRASAPLRCVHHAQGLRPPPLPGVHPALCCRRPRQAKTRPQQPVALLM